MCVSIVKFYIELADPASSVPPYKFRYTKIITPLYRVVGQQVAYMPVQGVIYIDTKFHQNLTSHSWPIDGVTNPILFNG